MNVLIVLGHPRADSYCGALARAYAAGAAGVAGVHTRFITLAELDFDLQVRVDSPENQCLEPDLQQAREALAWAEHLVFVYPTWWGTMPALLKGFLDRMVMPGDAFRFYGPGAMEWEALWKGKSGQIITTMDTPPPVYRLIYRAPGHHAMKDATFGFCGVKPVRVFARGPLRTSDAGKRARWLDQVQALGAGLSHGVRSRPGRIVHRCGIWLRALRLQFYPMTWAAYTVGALAGAAAALDWTPYLWGYLFLFALEAATVFCNDYFDYDSDTRNHNYGPFTGGSRVLVDGSLDSSRLRWGMAAALFAAACCAALTLGSTTSPLAVLAWFAVAGVLTLGYTAPPLRLCYRGLGEADVAVTHSLLVLMIGYVLQGGASLNAAPWLISAPLALAIAPSIVLAGIPDREADASVAKHTVAERFGVRAALGVAGIALIVSSALGVALDIGGVLGGVFTGLAWPVALHAGAGLWQLRRVWQRFDQGESPPRRIDLALFVTLNYMLWFVAVPLYWLV